MYIAIYMPKTKEMRISTIVILVFLSLFDVLGQSTLPDFKMFDPDTKISPCDFGIYLDSITNGNWDISVSPEDYSAWLQRKSPIIRATANSALKAFYYLENALTLARLKKYQQAYPFVDSALAEFPLTEFPELHMEIAAVGHFITGKNADYRTRLRYDEEKLKAAVYPSGSPVHIAVLLDMAFCHWKLNEYKQSMEYCQRAYPFLVAGKNIKDRVETLLLMYNNAHFSTRDSSFTDYLKEAETLALELDDSLLLAKVYTVIGLSHYRRSHHQEALKFYKKSRSLIHEKGSSEELEAAIFQQLCYTLIDSVEQVGTLSAYIMRMARQNGLLNTLGNAYRARSWYFAKIKKKDSAIFYMDKAFHHRQGMAEKKDVSPGFYYYLYEVAMLIPDYEKAMEYLTLYSEQFRKISQNTNAEQLAVVRAEMDYELQKEKIEKLKLENKLEKENAKRQKIVIIAILILFFTGLAFLVFARLRYKQIKRSYQSLVRKNIEMDKLNQRLQAVQLEFISKKNEANGNLTIPNEDEIFVKLDHLLHQEKIYRQEDINLTKMARKLKTNRTYLSSIVNHRYEDSFNGIINKCRIQEARSLLANPKYSNYSIEGIAKMVGYRSRSAFYNSFKQITGLTPLQYMRNSEAEK